MQLFSAEREYQFYRSMHLYEMEEKKTKKKLKGCKKLDEKFLNKKNCKKKIVAR